MGNGCALHVPNTCAKKWGGTFYVDFDILAVFPPTHSSIGKFVLNNGVGGMFVLKLGFH